MASTGGWYGGDLVAANGAARLHARPDAERADRHRLHGRGHVPAHRRQRRLDVPGRLQPGDVRRELTAASKKGWPLDQRRRGGSFRGAAPQPAASCTWCAGKLGPLPATKGGIMKATSRSTLPVLTRVTPRKAARRPALLLVLALLICLAALVAGVFAQTADAAVTRDGTTTPTSGTACQCRQRELLAHHRHRHRPVDAGRRVLEQRHHRPHHLVGDVHALRRQRHRSGDRGEDAAGRHPQLRYSAIYKLLNPPSGVTGTVLVTFSGAVGNGIVAGAADFAGVDQTTPLGTAVGAPSTSTQARLSAWA